MKVKRVKFHNQRGGMRVCYHARDVPLDRFALAVMRVRASRYAHAHRAPYPGGHTNTDANGDPGFTDGDADAKCHTITNQHAHPDFDADALMAHAANDNARA
jgi:hypothetical protein